MLHNETITVRHRTRSGKDASFVPTATLTDTVIDRCNVQPVGTNESVGEPQPITSRWRVATSDPQDWISANDAVTWRGDQYEVLGRPQTFWAIKPHTEFIIFRTEG